MSGGGNGLLTLMRRVWRTVYSLKLSCRQTWKQSSLQCHHTCNHVVPWRRWGLHLLINLVLLIQHLSLSHVYISQIDTQSCKFLMWYTKSDIEKKKRPKPTQMAKLLKFKTHTPWEGEVLGKQFSSTQRTFGLKKFSRKWLVFQKIFWGKLLCSIVFVCNPENEWENIFQQLVRA